MKRIFHAEYNLKKKIITWQEKVISSWNIEAAYQPWQWSWSTCPVQLNKAVKNRGSSPKMTYNMTGQKTNLNIELSPKTRKK